MSNGVIRTKVGWAGFGDYHYGGKLLYRDVVGSTSFLGHVAFALLGTFPPAEDVRVLDDIASCLQCPEPRVWPTKLIRVAASNGRFVPGMLGGWSALVSGIGSPQSERAAQTLIDLRERIDAAAATNADGIVRAYVKRPDALSGFGTHARRIDERIAPLRASVEKHGRAGRPYWAMAERFWRIAGEEKDVEINFWGAAPAALLDLGFAPTHMQPLLSVLFHPSSLAHAFEGATAREPSLRELPADAIRYVGHAPRVSPRESGK